MAQQRMKSQGQETFARIRTAIENTTPDARRHPCRETLGAYLAHQLPRESVAQVDQHLMLCADNSCQKILADFSKNQRSTLAFVIAWLHQLPIEMRSPAWVMRTFGAAAVLVLLILISDTLLPTAVPSYSGELRGGQKTWLQSNGNQPQEAPVYYWDSIIELTLRPERTRSGPVEVRMFLVQTRGVEEIDVSSSLQRGSSGAFHLQRRVGDLLQQRSGRFYMLVGVGRPGSLPSQKAVFDVGLNGDPINDRILAGGWQWFRWKLEVRKGHNDSNSTQS